MAQTQLQNFIGQGITLPLILVKGKPQLKSGFDLIKSSIITILSWRIFTRFFLKEFGSQIDQLLEEPNDQILEDTVRVFVIDAVQKWEPRITIIQTNLFRTDTTMDLTITCQILNTKSEETFTFPFYKKIIY